MFNDPFLLMVDLITLPGSERHHSFASDIVV